MPSPSEEGETEQMERTERPLLPARPGNKRMQPETAVAAPITKRRASRACMSCRSRKVRCDVTSQHIPCTNCRLDSVECLLTASNRGRTRTVPDTVIIEPQHPQPPSQTHHSPQQQRIRRLSSAVATSPQFFVSPRSVSDNGDSTSICSPEEDTNTAAGILTGIATGTVSNITSGVSLLPAHFKPLPPHLQPIDIEYLARKGALTLPPEEMQREIILKHIQYVHPFMPVIDLRAFLTPLVRREPGSVSLLLFQAVMFTSANFIDMEYHMVPGQTTPPDHAAIRKEFFTRARLLYDHDCETDRFTLLQALLLMTVWYQRPGDEKETWYWTGVMLSLAQTLGLHRNPAHLTDVPPETRLLRKHIWWSCLIQDRLLALGLKRPSRIRLGDYDVPSLTFADFNIDTLSNELLRYLGPLPLSDDTPSKTSIVMAFISLSKLCEHIGAILDTQYSSLLSSGVSSATSAATSLDHMGVMVVPRKASACRAELEQCDTALDAWTAALDSGARFRAGRHEKDSSHRVLWLHQALLHMVYLTTVVMLHRPRVLQADGDGNGLSTSGPGGPEGAAVDDPDDPDYATEIRRSKDKITQAAAGITEVVYDLYHDNQLRFVSPAAISALVSATLIHLFDVRSASPDARYTSIGRFYQCWQALHYLRGLYTSADQSIAFLEFYINRKQINIPMLNLASASTVSGGTSPTSPSVATPHSMSVMATLHGDGTGVPDMHSSASPMRHTPSAVTASLPDMGSTMDSIVVGPQPQHQQHQHDQWSGNGMGAVDNLLQSFIDFSADSAFFNSNPDSMVASPMPGNLRYV
ncbi:hypothetical protein SEUCBS139899_002926 [Sporothrix eucalyptigena]